MFAERINPVDLRRFEVWAFRSDFAVTVVVAFADPAYPLTKSLLQKFCANRLADVVFRPSSELGFARL
jgi:hypothetical protein